MAYLLSRDLPTQWPPALSRADFSAAFPGEGDHLEFKQGIPEHKIREAVAAFSNADGGVILIGVAPDGRPVGIEVGEETLANLHRAVGGVRHPGRYDIGALVVDGRTVLGVSVRRRREGFAQLGDGRILVRRGAMNSPLFDAELTRFVGTRALTRFETTPVGITTAEADPALVERLRSVYSWGPGEVLERLAEVDLVEAPSPSARLTVAGALFLRDRPAAVLGKAFVEIFRHRDASASYDRRLEFGGTADEQVASATEAVSAELGADVVVLGLRRHEVPRIPIAVLREALANAVAHRDYQHQGRAIRVDLHPDRVVITSPGGLPEPVTVANLREQNAARNPAVIRVLRRHRLAEDAGLGIDVMQDTMRSAMLEPPRFEADDDRVRVTLVLTSAVAPQERAWIAEVEQRGRLRPGDRLLLLHAARGERLTNAAVRDALGVDSVDARITLQRLRDDGFLRQHGTRGNASYTLAAELNPPAGLGLEPEELREVVLTMAADAAVTNADVRSRTGLDRAQSLALLNGLVAAGELRREGERRGTRYVRA